MNGWRLFKNNRIRKVLEMIENQTPFQVFSVADGLRGSVKVESHKFLPVDSD